MRQIILTEDAYNDLENILFEGIVKFGLFQALKYQTSIKQTFELLAGMPGLGRKSERGSENEHRFIHGSHVIYYVAKTENIIIQRIIYGPSIEDIWGKG